ARPPRSPPRRPRGTRPVGPRPGDSPSDLSAGAKSPAHGAVALTRTWPSRTRPPPAARATSALSELQAPAQGGRRRGRFHRLRALDHRSQGGRMKTPRVAAAATTPRVVHGRARRNVLVV